MALTRATTKQVTHKGPATSNAVQNVYDVVETLNTTTQSLTSTTNGLTSTTAGLTTSVNNLNAATSALDSFTQTGAGAVARTLDGKLADFVSVKDFGAVGDGVTNDTAAFAAALAASFNVYIPPGTYLANIAIPAPPAAPDGVAKGYNLVGTQSSIIQQVDNTKPVIYKSTANNNRLYNGVIGPLVVKPHASGTSQPAIKVVGFTCYLFNHIRGLSNGAQGFPSLFYNSAYPSFSYFNTFNSPSLEGQFGYTKVFDFQNDGQGIGLNSNAVTINDARIYNNMGMSVAIDANNSYGVWINQPFIEGNPGCMAIKMGQHTTVNQGALEGNGGHFDYSGALPAKYCTVQGTYLGSGHNIPFNSTAFGNVWINVWEAGGGNTWTGSYGRYNQRIEFGPFENPVQGTWTRVSGPTGTAAQISFEVVTPTNALTRTATVKGVQQWSASAPGYVNLQFSPPTNTGLWKVASMSVSVFDPFTGIPITVGTTADGKVIFNAGAAQPYYIEYYVSLYLP